MNITYDYYRIFYFVAKYQSFTKAASILLSNEPNISRSIRNLEHEFGVSLFIRSNRGVTLTPEGQKLYTRVAAAHHQLSSAEAELADAKALRAARSPSASAKPPCRSCCCRSFENFTINFRRSRSTFPA